MCPARFVERIDRSDVDTASERSEQAPAPLVVGAADDRAEVEADRVAGEVIARLYGAPDAHVHAAGCDHAGVRRSAAPSGTAEVGLEGGAISDHLSARIEGRRGSGSSLPGGVRSRLESGFGSSLADVRIHTDQESADLNRAVSARAFTTGKDIFFGAGEYRPDSPDGEHMLAHEVAHTQQQASGARRTAIHRWWDFSQPKLDWGRTAAIRTLKTRFVWFVRDAQGDEMVVKLENQPVGLGQLTGEMHSAFGTAGSVVQKRLDDQDRTRLGTLLDTPTVAAGDSWGAFAKKNPGFPANPLPKPVDDANANEYGRLQAVNELRTSGDNLLAMTMAAGKSAADTASPNFGGTGYDPNVSMFRTQLERPAHAKQLGRIAAVDLFMGNDDRVTAGNLGNWFDDPKGAVTLIDHVDQGSFMAAKFRKGKDLTSWIDRCGVQLESGALAATAAACVEAMGRLAKHEGGDTGAPEWLEEVIDGKKRGDVIAANILEGLREQRKTLIKVFTLTRFTAGGGQARKQKKAIKALAKKTAEEDSGHSAFGNDGAEYYDVMKSRAAWLKKN